MAELVHQGLDGLRRLDRTGVRSAIGVWRETGIGRRPVELNHEPRRPDERHVHLR